MKKEKEIEEFMRKKNEDENVKLSEKAEKIYKNL